jgi:hypothetical protein
MELIKHLPDNLIGPRTYFSLIDKNNIRQVKDWNEYKKELDQVLKILLLTKDSIVIAGSSLCNDMAFDYFSDESKGTLFRKGIIKPAIRSQFSNFSEVFEDRIKNKKENLSNEINKYFSENITEIVPWDLYDNSNWYKDQISKQVYNKNSILRNNLKNIDNESEKLFVKLITHEFKEIEKTGNYFDRDKISMIIHNNFTGVANTAITQFLDLLYYISGSRVVNCENYVPQENLIYYSHATMNYGNKIISDKSVFYNIVTQIILSDVYDNTFPIDIIKNISFKDIVLLRESNKAKSKTFREKYEKCLKSAQNIQSAHDKDVLLLNLQELTSLSSEIQAEFRNSILNELSSFKSKIKISGGFEYIYEIISQLIGLFVLPVSIINLMFNDAKLKETNKLKKVRAKTINAKENLIRKYIKEKYGNDPVLLSFFNDIVKKHKENYLTFK